MPPLTIVAAVAANTVWKKRHEQSSAPACRSAM
jgi:hypothetical protein